MYSVTTEQILTVLLYPYVRGTQRLQANITINNTNMHLRTYTTMYLQASSTIIVYDTYSSMRRMEP